MTMTAEELEFHLRECEAPEGFCIVCDIAKAAINSAYERAKQAILKEGERWETEYGEDMENEVAASKDLAALMDSLKDQG